jgi:hypothetical protein
VPLWVTRVTLTSISPRFWFQNAQIAEYRWALQRGCLYVANQLVVWTKRHELEQRRGQGPNLAQIRRCLLLQGQHCEAVVWIWLYPVRVTKDTLNLGSNRYAKCNVLAFCSRHVIRWDKIMGLWQDMEVIRVGQAPYPPTTKNFPHLCYFHCCSHIPELMIRTHREATLHLHFYIHLHTSDIVPGPVILYPLPLYSPISYPQY